MHLLITDNLTAIRSLAREFGVARLEVFGSVTTDAFDPKSSDIDFLVEYPADYDRGPLYRRHFALQRALATLIGHPVDLVEMDALRDPWFARAANQTRRVVFNASDLAQIA